jgi:XTP/dITP diphosphohydrolase
MKKMTALLIASNNPGKQRELRSLLEGLKLTLVTPQELALQLHVEESGDTYAENARRKATLFAQASGLWTLADDSGLEVDVLDGAPGLHSARLIGAGGSDADRRTRLLSMLQPHPHPWTARFRCWMALSSPESELDFSEGFCEGEIIAEERGEGGFGYDPIFLVRNTSHTMAELSTEEKNRVSHRAHAVKAILPTLAFRLGLI